jgi:hypothetical protein
VNEEQVDFLEKLVLVERDITALVETLPPGVSRARAESIATVIRLLKARFALFGPVILPSKKTLL